MSDDTVAPEPAFKTSTEVRSKLVETLELDLVGPSNGHICANELLPQSPQRWYLTGFLIPQSTPEDQRKADDDEKVDEAGDRGSGDEDEAPEPQNRVSFMPSSMGMSVLALPETKLVKAVVRWGDYQTEAENPDEQVDPEEIDRDYENEAAKRAAEHEAAEERRSKKEAPPPGESEQEPPRRLRRGYRRLPRQEYVDIALNEDHGSVEIPLPNSDGLRVDASWRSLAEIPGSPIRKDTKAMSVFVLNDRPVHGANLTFHEIAFQVELELEAKEGFLGRPDLRGLAALDEPEYDERIADLHYRDVLEYAVGHGVSVRRGVDSGETCSQVRTTWIPSSEVARMDHAAQDVLGGVELEMERLADLADEADAQGCLDHLVVSYRAWIESQEAKISSSGLSKSQEETAQNLVNTAKVAADRIEEGINLLADPQIRKAFCTANRAMARAARQRFSRLANKKPEDVDAPQWYAFQLAFLLMNMAGLADPRHPNRKTVDLLFFPTGGGKTEAYLGLAAFTLILRRLRYPGISSAGVSIIMRYTLRLLTLDQLGRAAALMCALELERDADKELGEWPFEIGLWVGSAATPNRMGKSADKSPGKDKTAYSKLSKFQNDSSRHPSPIPLEECPWCGKRFSKDCFHLDPDGRAPRDLRVACEDMHCEFSSAQGKDLPIVGVDEPIYRRLPAFLIATVDKFAALPWTGHAGNLFGKVSRYDKDGFYGACDSPSQGSPLPEGQLPPPDLIIQDELHLISGPLGTIAGIYETAIEALCMRQLEDETVVLPKIVASTATVRRASRQIRALFGREDTAIFPPQGPDRNDSFFSHITPVSEEDPGRLYLGIAAPGRNMKVIYLRTALALLAAAKHLYLKAGGYVRGNPCDPYMSMLSYFNSLRELGGCRRIVEDEVYAQLQARYKRNRDDPDYRLFVDRYIKRTPVELTSRVGTNDVARAKRELAADFSVRRDPDFEKREQVDVALATNMISVGLDITRLGLMVVFGQPKTSAEYIQATSRVGRDRKRPGLVVTLLNAHKPRDRSYYERFSLYHETFYRAVEASSVTPFAPRALDRGLSAALVGLCRHALPDLEAASRAGSIGAHIAVLQDLVRVFAERARGHDAYMDPAMAEELKDHVDHVAQELLSKWLQIATQCASEGIGLRYQRYEGKSEGDVLLRDFLDAELTSKGPEYHYFRANRSMRDVEPAVDILTRKSAQGTNKI